MNEPFDMERLYRRIPKSTLQMLRTRLESGRSIIEIVSDLRRIHAAVAAVS